MESLLTELILYKRRDEDFFLDKLLYIIVQK